MNQDPASASSNGDDAERYRERARSVAGLAAAAAGGIAVALLSDSVVSLTDTARWIGIGAVSALALSCILFVLASVTQNRLVKTISTARAFWLPWQLQIPLTTKATPAEGLAALRARILKFTTAGLVAGLIAICGVVALLCAELSTEHQRTAAMVTFDSQPPIVAPCGQLPKTLAATVETANLNTPSGYIEFSVTPGKSCPSATKTTNIYLARSSIVVSSAP